MTEHARKSVADGEDSTYAAAPIEVEDPPGEPSESALEFAARINRGPAIDVLRLRHTHGEAPLL